jgi:hypothetical protein
MSIKSEQMDYKFSPQFHALILNIVNCIFLVLSFFLFFLLFLFLFFIKGVHNAKKKSISGKIGRFKSPIF